jgi:hypothetical protein
MKEINGVINEAAKALPASHIVHCQFTTSLDSSNQDNNMESKEPDYNNDGKSDEIGEDKQEEQMGEITGETTNQVFWRIRKL